MQRGCQAAWQGSLVPFGSPLDSLLLCLDGCRCCCCCCVLANLWSRELPVPTSDGRHETPCSLQRMQGPSSPPPEHLRLNRRQRSQAGVLRERYCRFEPGIARLRFKFSWLKYRLRGIPQKKKLCIVRMAPACRFNSDDVNWAWGHRHAPPTTPGNENAETRRDSMNDSRCGIPAETLQTPPESSASQQTSETAPSRLMAILCGPLKLSRSRRYQVFCRCLILD